MKKLFHYVILGAIGLSCGMACHNTRMKDKQQKETVHVRHDETFDPETYVDPYGITTCYPSDRERVSRQREERRRKYQNAETSPRTGKYHYRVTITNASREWETYERQELINGEVRFKKTSPDVAYLNGTYVWDSDVYLPDEDAMFDYIVTHYDKMKKYKLAEPGNIYDEFNDNLDAYLEDPEDEVEFDPDIYDFLSD